VFGLIAKRLLLAIPNLIGVVIITFLLTRALPGDPAAYFAGPAANKEAIEQIRVKLGLDRPLPEQFVRYVKDLAGGDLGNSLTTGQPVVTEIRNRLPASAELTLFGLVISISIAVPLGILAAVKQGSWIDHACRVVATAGVSLPVFFTGLLLVYVFYFLLGWSPAPLGRLDVFFSAPPQVTSFYLIDSLIARDFGLFRSALSQLILPGITTLGMVFSFLLGANVLVEKVFAWPGIGSYAVEALIASDFAPVQGFVLTMAILYVALNLIIDVLYGLIDPRVRLEG
jgi:peptide/nickel transport system permease protein